MVFLVVQCQTEAPALGPSGLPQSSINPPDVQSVAWPLPAQEVGFSLVFAGQVCINIGQVCLTPGSNARVSLQGLSLWCSAHRVLVSKASGSLPAHLPRSVMVAELCCLSTEDLEVLAESGVRPGYSLPYKSWCSQGGHYGPSYVFTVPLVAESQRVQSQCDSMSTLLIPINYGAGSSVLTYLKCRYPVINLSETGLRSERLCYLGMFPNDSVPEYPLLVLLGSANCSDIGNVYEVYTINI
jgi:hypothetical protein